MYILFDYKIHAKSKVNMSIMPPSALCFANSCLVKSFSGSPVQYLNHFNEKGGHWKQMDADFSLTYKV